MASGGSSGRSGTGTGTRSFDFGSDDVLCAYDDFPPQDHPNGKRADQPVKDFHESRTGRPLVDVYGQQEEFPREDILSAVERCMKKYADNLLRSLEGISGRLAQLELYYYKLERSIGELRSDMVRDQIEKDRQLKSLEKHIQEVHRSVQILKDKQELAETQKELAKLQVVPKESPTLRNSQRSDEGVPASISELKKHDEITDLPNQQLALVPRQTPARPPSPAIVSQPNQPYKEMPMQQPAHASLNMSQDRYALNQAGSVYLQHQTVTQDQHSQPLQSEPQYVQQRPQVQEQAPAQQHSFSHYQQQWPQPSPQQFPLQAAQSQQPTSQAQSQSQTPASYPTYPPHQPSAVPDVYPGSMPIQVPYATISQPGSGRSESVSFYSGPVSAISQLPHHNIQRPPQPQGSQSSFALPVNKGGYTGAASYPIQGNVQGYNSTYNTVSGSRGALPQNFHPGSYPPSNVSAFQNQQVAPSNTPGLHPGQQLMRNHPFGEMIEKAASMGYPRDLVASVIQRMMDAGQPFDLNALLDRLNTHAVGTSPRGWSG